MAVQLGLPRTELYTGDHDLSNVKIFTGRSNPGLAAEIAQYLGAEISPAIIKNFSDGELYVQIKESVRGFDAYVIQPTCTPVNESLMELLLMLDALKRASAKTITAVIPYYGYARQDRKTTGREPISAKLVADLITSAGADRVVAMDLHTGQLQGFFNILVDHLYATPILCGYIKEKHLENLVIVSPDAGGVERARVYAKKLNCPIAIIDKRRSAHNIAEVYNIIGDIQGKTAIVVDDMIDTAGTICSGAKMLLDEGATSVYALAAHPIFSGPAVERIADSVFEEVVVTNSIPLSESARQVRKIVQLSIAPVLGEAIGRIHDHQSVSEMFQ
ncbi:MAG: ribose-phosphate pyrophosphokinase [Vampirovibrionales bacterium]|nr:ribose-phosphate pyrophosphokinase [Vampirovibrionales bacterium]